MTLCKYNRSIRFVERYDIECIRKVLSGISYGVSGATHYLDDVLPAPVQFPNLGCNRGIHASVRGYLDNSAMCGIGAINSTVFQLGGGAWE